MSNTTKIWLLAGVLAIAGSGFSLVSQRQARAAAGTQVAQTAKTEPLLVAAAGRIEPAGEEVKVGSELDGKLAEVLVEEGDAVRRGQVLAILHNADFQARVSVARAAAAGREAQLERLRNGARVEEKREAEAVVREAEAYLVTATAERDRRQTLLTRGAISRSEFDFTTRDVETAQARLAAARERLKLVRQQTRSEDLSRAEAELSHARALLAEAQAMLEKTRLRSPLDGTVLRKYRKAGESVSSNGDTPVVSLGDLRRLVVRVDVDEADVARVFAGQRAWVRADAFGEKKFYGRVRTVGQALGRKNVRTDEPAERVDTKILETLIELDPGARLPVGLRVDAFLEPRPQG